MFREMHVSGKPRGKLRGFGVWWPLYKFKYRKKNPDYYYNFEYKTVFWIFKKNTFKIPINNLKYIFST